jgi:CDP-paratose 2-epimerase
MNILITGGAGFIGSNLAAHHLKKGDKVTLYDNLSRPGVEQNLDWLLTLKGKLVHINADINDVATLNIAVKKQHRIYHEAGQTAVTTSLTNPVHDFQVNALGTFHVVEAVRTQNPKATLIYASTNKVYGSLPGWQFKQSKTRYVPTKQAAVSETEPLDFHSPYGCSKGAGDQYVRDYARSYGLKTVVFRQSCIYGEHQLGVEDQGWLAHFAAQAIKGLPITIFGDGKQVRDVLYIGDLVEAYELAATHIDTTAGHIYNLGGGVDHTLSLLELIALLKKRLGPVSVTMSKPRVGDQLYYVSNLAKAKHDFHWVPKISVETGVDRLVTWLQTAL